VRQGARGQHVLDYQQMLARAGVYHGTIDGVFGPRTDLATRKFQAWLGAKPDGWYGPRSSVAGLQRLAPMNTDSSMTTDPVVPWIADWSPNG